MARTRKRRKAPTRRRRVGRKNPISKRAAKARAKKAARTRKRRKTTTRRRRSAARRRRNPTRRRRSAARRRRNPTRRRRSAARRRRRNPTRRRRGVMARRRRRNPTRRRRSAARRRYGRRNPANGSIKKLVMEKVLPVAASLYVSRLISGKLMDKMPGLDRIPDQFRGPALAAALLAGGHFATKKVKPLKKYREGIMVGLGINLIDKLLGAFAPDSVKDMFGIGDADLYGPALADYVAVDDYIAIGADPIQDDITLADYVQIGQYDGEGLEEDLGEFYSDMGEMEQDLGMEMDLGALPPGGGFANRHLGGVHRNQMLAPVQSKRYRAPVPARSFTKPVPHIGEGFDKPGMLYTGIFGGGFGF